MRKKILVTAGSTNVPIDKVRVISNIFRGRTGAEIALNFGARGDNVTLITSDKNILNQKFGPYSGLSKVIHYKTYDDLYHTMREEIMTNNYDVIIHSAAVSDYYVADVCGKDLQPIDKSGKISSDCKDLYLHLAPTQKIIDLIREDWGFKGYLVKFKLQVGISDYELLEIAQRSRLHSKADMIVANCLEWAKERAYIITNAKEVINVPRDILADKIYKLILEEEV